jgi:hypothetical protein
LNTKVEIKDSIFWQAAPLINSISSKRYFSFEQEAKYLVQYLIWQWNAITLSLVFSPFLHTDFIPSRNDAAFQKGG